MFLKKMLCFCGDLGIMFCSYIFLNSRVHSVLCNLFWWQAFKKYDCVYYLHIYVLPMHGNIPWAGYLPFILHSVCIVNRFSPCLHSELQFDLCLAVLFSNFTAFSLGNNFHLLSTCPLLFGKKKKKTKTNLCFSLWQTFSFVCLLSMLGCFLVQKTISEMCTAVLWERELNSYDSILMIQKRLWGDSFSHITCRKTWIQEDWNQFDSVNSHKNSCFPETRKLFSITL